MENNVTEALSGIEIALRESIIMSKQEDEFTVHDFITRSQADGQILSYDAADKLLRRNLWPLPLTNVTQGFFVG